MTTSAEAAVETWEDVLSQVTRPNVDDLLGVRTPAEGEEAVADLRRMREELKHIERAWMDGG